MKIKTDYYDFYRESGIYYIENTHATYTITYQLYAVKNGVTSIVGEILNLVAPGITDTLVFDGEGIYNLTIIYASSDGIGTDTSAYDIRNFPTLKASVIDTMKNMICDCLSLDNDILNCTNTTVTPIAQDLYDTQSLLTSMGMYQNMLLSPSFLRKYICCFTTSLGTNSITLLLLLQGIYTQLSARGTTPNSTHLVRLYTSYVYILLYVMELDIEQYETGVNLASTGLYADDSDSDDVAALKVLFDFEGMASCFNGLSISPDNIFTALNTCYRTNAFGTCTPLNESDGSGNPPDPTDDPPADDNIEDLSYTSYAEYVEVGATIVPTTFTWTSTGISEKNLELDDNGEAKIVAQSVTGKSYSSGATNYTKAIPASVVWTLSGDNVSDVNLTTNWIYPSFSGENITGVLPVEAEILGGTKQVANVSTSITVTVATAVGEYGWIAVPATTPQYTRWVDVNNALNGGDIGAPAGTELMFLAAATVSVNSVAYYVYMYKWPTELNTNLKLS
jgi:hypothetical protein